jgi:hypothetical protein
MTEPTSTARRIAEFAEQHPEYTAIAFDNDGKIIDWKESGDWVNGAHAGERLYTIEGGTISEDDVQRELDRQDAER